MMLKSMSFPSKLQSHDNHMMRFIGYDSIHILSLLNLNNNVVSIQKDRGDKPHRVIVALNCKAVSLTVFTIMHVS